jgi:hypothetical protein
MLKFQTFSVSTSFRRGWRRVRTGGGAGRPADMVKSSECRTNFGRFWLRRGTGFAGFDGCKDCAMSGTETGEGPAGWIRPRIGQQQSKQKRMPVSKSNHKVDNCFAWMNEAHFRKEGFHSCTYRRDRQWIWKHLEDVWPCLPQVALTAFVRMEPSPI